MSGSGVSRYAHDDRELARHPRRGDGTRCAARRDDRTRASALFAGDPTDDVLELASQTPRRPAGRPVPDAQGPAPGHDHRGVAGRPLPAADHRRAGRRRARCGRREAAEDGDGHAVFLGVRVHRARDANQQRRAPDRGHGRSTLVVDGRTARQTGHRLEITCRGGHPHRQRRLGPEPLPPLEPCARRLPEGGADDRADCRDPGAAASSYPAVASTASTSSTAAPASSSSASSSPTRRSAPRTRSRRRAARCTCSTVATATRSPSRSRLPTSSTRVQGSGLSVRPLEDLR